MWIRSLTGMGPQTASISSRERSRTGRWRSEAAGLTRLRELGLTPGAKVTMVRRAPFGEPIEITVRGSHLAMRNHEAADISISLA